LVVIDRIDTQLKSQNADHPNSRQRERYSRIVWFALVLLCFFASFYLIRKARFAGEDSWFPMSRALDFLDQTPMGQVYQTLFFFDHIKFQYPPSGLLLLDFLRRLGLGSFAQLNLINACLLIAAGLAFAVLIVQLFGSLRWSGYRLPLGPVAFLVAVQYYPNRLALQFGQIQILLGLLFMLACLAMLHRKYFLAGVLIATAATVKPQFLFFGLLLLWQKNWQFVVGFVVLAGAAFLLSIGLYGWQNHADYLKVLGFLSQHGEYHHLNQSINGIFNRYLYDGPSVDIDPDNPIPNSGFPPYIATVYVSSILTSLVLIVIPFLLPREESSVILKLAQFCVAAILFTMASPIAWVHHYNVLLPGYVVALKLVFDRKQSGNAWLIPLLVLGTSVVLTGLPIVAPFGPTIPSLNLLQSHVFFGAVLLVGVILFELFWRTENRLSNMMPPNSRFGVPG
jgi:alpha-1,2-mannosyltransferase